MKMKKAVQSWPATAEPIDTTETKQDGSTKSFTITFEDASTVKITIPESVTILQCVPLDYLPIELLDEKAFNWQPFEAVCVASGLDICDFRKNHAKALRLIISWYKAHLAEGGLKSVNLEAVIMAWDWAYSEGGGATVWAVSQFVHARYAEALRAMFSS